MWNANNLGDPYAGGHSGNNPSNSSPVNNNANNMGLRSIAALAAYNADVSANAAAFAAAADNARYAAALHQQAYTYYPHMVDAATRFPFAAMDPAFLYHPQQPQQLMRSPATTVTTTPTNHNSIGRNNNSRAYTSVLEDMEQHHHVDQERRARAASYPPSRGKPASVVAMQQARGIAPPPIYNNSEEPTSEDEEDSFDSSDLHRSQQQQQQQHMSNTSSMHASETLVHKRNIGRNDDNATTSATNSSDDDSSSSSDSDDNRAIGTLATFQADTASNKKAKKKTTKKQPPKKKAVQTKQPKKTPTAAKKKKTSTTKRSSQKVMDSLGNIGGTEQLDSLATTVATTATTRTGDLVTKPPGKQQQRKRPQQQKSSTKKSTPLIPASASSEVSHAAIATNATSSVVFRDKTLETHMTMEEYENVTDLFQVFCQLPLLSEFTKPLAQLHPELASLYGKIISHPMDLSKICYSIQEKKYLYSRHVQLDVWRLCSNCILFHSDPRAQKEMVAIPSFVSIAMHLRDYFHALWEEYMIPSSTTVDSEVVEAVEVTSHSSTPSTVVADGFFTPETILDVVPTTTTSTLNRSESSHSVCSVVHSPHVFQTRTRNRKLRYAATASTPLSSKSCIKIASFMQYFIDHGGRVDSLDVDAILGDESESILPQHEKALVIAKMVQMRKCLIQCADSLAQTKGESSSDDEEEEAPMEISVLEIQDHFHSITNLPCVVASPKAQSLLRDRLDRMLQKLIVPIYEAGCRGVNQSSVWGCMAAAIWARESSRKPYWPALVLGILAPEDQKEDWHTTLTERNEGRFPEKLRIGLSAGKKKAAMALEKSKGKKEEQMSHFLCEFLGKHQFTWVREADILENFDPKQDPNDPSTVIPGAEGKKQRKPIGHPVSDTAIYNMAVQECQWAVEEFDMQVRDPCGDFFTINEKDEIDVNDEECIEKYNFSILAQAPPSEEGNNEITPDEETDDEGEALYATEGVIDLTSEGRKRFLALSSFSKRQREAASRKEKTESAKREKAATVRSRKKPQGSSSKTKKGTTPAVGSEVSSKKRKLGGTTVKAEQSSRKRCKSDKTDGTKGGNLKKRSSSFIPDKKGRARAKVRAYVSKLIQKGLLVPSVAPITASSSAPSGGSVDTNGLMGMALAFRAAAGEIPGVDPREESEIRPWDFVVDATNTSEPNSQELCQLMKRQIELLEKAVGALQTEKLQREQQLVKCLRNAELVKATKPLDNRLARKKKISASSENGHVACKVSSTKSDTIDDQSNDVFSLNDDTSDDLKADSNQLKAAPSESDTEDDPLQDGIQC